MALSKLTIALAFLLFSVHQQVVSGDESNHKRLRGRELRQGNWGTKCDTPWGCEWGMSGSKTTTYIYPYWVNNTNVYWRCENPGQIALTFDDGPNVGTEFVLQELRKHDVKATFFINAQNLVGSGGTKFGSYLTTAEAEGHVIAHHTYNHANITEHIESIGGDDMIFDQDGKINKLTKKFFIDQFIVARNLANPYLPLKGIRPYLRPPYLALTDKMATVMKSELDMYVVQINLDTKDFEDPENVHERVKENLDYWQSGNSWIFLHHDMNYIGEYVKHIANVVATGKARGYRFVGIDECLGFPDEVDSRPRTPEPTTTPTMSPVIAPTIPVGIQCTGDPCEEGGRCRSQHGFCGDTEEHCNDFSIWTQSCNENVEQREGCKGDPCGAWECRNAGGECGRGPEFCTADALWRYTCLMTGGSDASAVSAWAVAGALMCLRALH